MKNVHLLRNKLYSYFQFIKDIYICQQELLIGLTAFPTLSWCTCSSDKMNLSYTVSLINI